MELTIRVINRLGYYTVLGLPRWNYIAIPAFVWTALDNPMKRRIIAYHYKREGGTELAHLFA